MSLRARLLVGLVALVTVGLATVGAVTYAEQRSFLLQRVDQEVTSRQVSDDFNRPGTTAGGQTGAIGPATIRAPFHDHRPPTGDGGGGGPVALPPSTYIVVRDAAGHAGASTTKYGPTLPPPKLPATIPLSQPGHARPINVGSVGATGLDYRVYAIPMPGAGGTTIFAVPLREIDQTLQSLIEVEGLVGGSVLLALGLLAMAVIRLGLRPLERIAGTADAIAAGDLSRRVEPATTRTEVGRLGRAGLHRA